MDDSAELRRSAPSSKKKGRVIPISSWLCRIIYEYRATSEGLRSFVDCSFSLNDIHHQSKLEFGGSLFNVVFPDLHITYSCVNQDLSRDLVGH